MDAHPAGADGAERECPGGWVHILLVLCGPHVTLPLVRPRSLSTHGHVWCWRCCWARCCCQHAQCCGVPLLDGAGQCAHASLVTKLPLTCCPSIQKSSSHASILQLGVQDVAQVLSVQLSVRGECTARWALRVSVGVAMPADRQPWIQDFVEIRGSAWKCTAWRLLVSKCLHVCPRAGT